MKIPTKFSLLVVSSQNFRRLVLLPLAIGTCLAGCGGPREHAVALTTDLSKAEASIQRTAVTLMNLREAKPDTDYHAITKALAQEYDTINAELAKVAKNAEDLNEVVAETQRQLSQLASPTTAGQATLVSDSAQRAAELNNALSALIRSRNTVNASGVYLPMIYNLVRDLAQNPSRSEVQNWKSRIADTVDYGDDLAGNLEDLNNQLKLISNLLAKT